MAIYRKGSKITTIFKYLPVESAVPPTKTLEKDQNVAIIPIEKFIESTQLGRGREI